jgi:hypothetical protein
MYLGVKSNVDICTLSEMPTSFVFCIIFSLSSSVSSGPRIILDINSDRLA